MLFEQTTLIKYRIEVGAQAGAQPTGAGGASTPERFVRGPGDGGGEVRPSGGECRGGAVAFEHAAQGELVPSFLTQEKKKARLVDIITFSTLC